MGEYIDQIKERSVEEYKNVKAWLGAMPEVEPKLEKLLSVIDDIRKQKEIYPKQEDILKAIATLHPKDIRCVILGQDPYPGTYENEKTNRKEPLATGLAFAIPKGVKLKSPSGKSLKNIRLAIRKESALKEELKNEDPDLNRYPKEGVLLLNSILTVESGKPLSHKSLTIEYEDARGEKQKWGWQDFSREVLKATIKDDDTTVVYLLFGNKAIDTMKSALKELGLKSKDIRIQKNEWKNVLGRKNKCMLGTYHPAYKGGDNFMKGRPFFEANKKLKELKQKPIVFSP